MDKFFGTALSFVFVLSIVGTPGPLIGVGDAVKHGVETSTSASINYPPEPPDPMEWFLPKYIAPQYVAGSTASNNVALAQENPAVNVNVDNWIEIKEEFDRKREGIKQEREERLARVKEGLDKMRDDIQKYD